MTTKKTGDKDYSEEYIAGWDHALLELEMYLEDHGYGEGDSISLHDLRKRMYELHFYTGGW